MLAAYGLPVSANEPEIIAHLLALYRQARASRLGLPLLLFHQVGFPQSSARSESFLSEARGATLDFLLKEPGGGERTHKLCDIHAE